MAEILRIEYSTRGLLASAGRDALVHIFDATQEYAHYQTLQNHGFDVPITALAFAVDGSRLVTMSGNATLALCTIEENRGSPISRYRRVRTRPTPALAYDVAVDATAKYVVCAGAGGRLDVRSLASGKRVRSYEFTSEGDGDSDVFRICVDDAGVYVACCCFDGSMRLFDFYSGARLALTNAHGDLVTCITFSTDGTKILSAGGDGCVHVWALAPELVRVATERQSELRAMQGQKKADDQMLASAPIWARTCSQRRALPTSTTTGARVSSANGNTQAPYHTDSERNLETTSEVNENIQKPSQNSFDADSRANLPRSAWQETISPRQLRESLTATFLRNGTFIAGISAPTLRHERLVLKSRQRSQETTVAVENMRARLAAMGILKDSVIQDPHTTHSLPLRIPTINATGQTDASSSCLGGGLSQQPTTLRPRDVYDDALKQLRAAADDALHLYAEMSSVGENTPCRSSNYATDPATAKFMTSEFQTTFSDISTRLASATLSSHASKISVSMSLKEPALGVPLSSVLEHYSDILVELIQKKIITTPGSHRAHGGPRRCPSGGS